MKKLILGVGIPGSGKTTVLKVFAKKYNYEYISADEVRAELHISHDNPLVASDNPLTISMWDEIREKTEEALLQGKTVVLDATFTSVDLRKEFISIAKSAGAEKIQGVFVDTPSQIAWERTKTRERQVPKEVFDNRVASIKENPPVTEDGFDAIFTTNEYEKIIKLETPNNEKKFNDVPKLK